MYQNATRSYEQANYLTANPMRLVLMCYEGAISNLKLAHDSYLAKEYEAKGRTLKKALDIIHELNASLDMNKGGEIALNLRSLYTFMIKALTEADLKRDLAIFGKVIRMLEELETEWKEVAGSTSRPLPTLATAIPAAPRQVAAAGGTWSA
jgi:flagellar protein FliS